MTYSISREDELVNLEWLSLYIINYNRKILGLKCECHLGVLTGSKWGHCLPYCAL